MTRRRKTLLAGLLLLLLPGGAVQAYTIPDPKRAMWWDEMLACDLIIVARHDSHDANSLSLKVVHVLKGDGVKANDVVRVAVEHCYRVVDKIGFSYSYPYPEVRMKDGVPNLGYFRRSYYGPGSDGIATAVSLFPDLTQNYIYFLPSKDKPALIRRNQVQTTTYLEDWRRTVAGKKSGLFFRIVQDISSKVRWDATEELHATRDRKVILRLVEEMFRKRSLDIRWAKEVFVGIGDRDGDLFDLLMNLVDDGARHVPPRIGWLAPNILVRLDPEKALERFARKIETGSPELKVASIKALGFLPTEKSLALLLKLMKQPRLAKASLESVRYILHLQDVCVVCPEVPPDRLEQLRTFAKPRLFDLQQSPVLNDELKKAVRTHFAYLWQRPPVLDLRRVEKVLLNPNSKVFRRPEEGPPHDFLIDLRNASEPNVVPILAKALAEVPASRRTDAWLFQDVVLHYAVICPNRLREELLRSKADAVLSTRMGTGFTGRESQICPQAGLVRTVNDMEFILRQSGGEHRLARCKVSDGLRSKVVKMAEGLIEAKYGNLPACLRILYVLDANKAGEIADRTLASKFHADSEWALTQAIAHGKKEYVDRLIERVRRNLNTLDPNRLSHDRWFHALLACGDPKAYKEYLKWLDAVPPISNVGSNPETARQYPETESLLPYKAGARKAPLLKAHAGDFLAHVLRRLESNSRLIRQGGQQVFVGALHWDFGFDYRAMADERKRMLRSIRPLMKELSHMSEVDIRFRVLQELGVKLGSKPDRNCLPQLQAAAASADPAISRNALELIEQISGEYGCLGLDSLPPVFRERALHVYFQDRHLIPASPGEGKPAP